MDEHGYVLNPLELKILILFLLRRIPGEMETEELMQLCQQVGAVSYFDFVVCVDELKENGQIRVEDGCCEITVRGSQNAEALETSLPYSVRSHAEKYVSAAAADRKRAGSILTSHQVRDGFCTVELGLNDGISDILQLRLLCADEAQARRMERRFRRNAESIYQTMINLLDGNHDELKKEGSICTP